MASQNLTPVGLEEAGILYPSNVIWNAPTSELYEHIIRRNEGTLSHFGTVVTSTGERTGRSANDKFIVREPSCEDKVWWGAVNREISEDKFNQLYEKVKAYSQHRDIFVQDCWAGADERYKLPVRIITEEARHSMFARNMFIRLTPEQLAVHKPEFTVIQMPHLHSDPVADGTNSSAFVVIHFRAATCFDRRNPIWRRDQEIDLFGHELSVAAEKDHVYALFRKLQGQQGQ